MANFELEKWYMDATDEKGRAFIGYSAKLRWKSVKLFYNGYTFCAGPSSAVIKRNSFSFRRLPEISAGEVRWKLLQAKAHWKKDSDPLHEVLLRLPEGEINWSCIFPKASATVQLGDEVFEKNTLGYVEKITISIPPWKIPIHELYWGRFLSADHVIVWIRWVGPVPKTLIYHNGNRFEAGVIASEIIIFDNYSLELNNKTTLRTGTLLSTVFSKFPMLTKLFPKAIMQLQENKWVSDGLLKLHGKTVSGGKVIHEHVIWQ
jgi:hypothetical protein